MGSSPSSWRIARARAWAALSSGSSAGARCTSRSWGRLGREANAGRPARRHPGSRAGGRSLAKKNNFFSAPGGRAPRGPAGLVCRAMAPARLAEGAEECAPAALDDALDRRPACEAGFSGAVVHEEEVLAALFDIGDRLRAVLLVQRGADRFLDCACEALGILARQRSPGPPRIELCAVQRLGDEDVAQAGQNALVHQRSLERALRAREKAVQAIEVDVLERIGPQRAQGGQLEQRLGLAAHEPAEQARIAVIHRPPVVQLQRGEDVGRRRLVRAPADPFPGHAEVREEALPSVEREQHPFAEALHAGQRMPRQLGETLRSLSADDAGAPGPGAHDALPQEPAAKLARGDLHFGQLGHEREFARLLRARKLSRAGRPPDFATAPATAPAKAARHPSAPPNKPRRSPPPPELAPVQRLHAEWWPGSDRSPPARAGCAPAARGGWPAAGPV